MSNAQKKEQARALYVKSGMNKKQIAEAVKITPKTLNNWIEEGKWDEQKESLQITRPQLLQEAYAQLAAINKQIRDEFNGVPPKHLSDSKAVIRKEIETFDKNPLHQYIEVFEEYVDWLSKTHPSQLAVFGETSMEFINHLSKRK